VIALGGVFCRLLVIDADDVALLAHLHRFGAVIGLLVALADGERHEGCLVFEHDLAHQLVGALAHAEEIEEAARLEAGDGLGADHAAIGDDADAADGESPAQAVDHRQQGRDVGGIAGPHLRANGTPIAVDQHGKDHLFQVGAMVLGVAAPAERLPALTFEIEAGRIHENQIESGEEVAPRSEEAFLNEVLDAAWRKWRASLLLRRRQFFAKPRHGAVEVMQLKPFRWLALRCADEGCSGRPSLSSSQGGRAMDEYRETFVGIDAAKEKMRSRWPLASAAARSPGKHRAD